MQNSKCTQFQAALAHEAHIHSWTKLATISGIPRTNLNSYATGRSRPSVEALRALSDHLPPEERAPLILAHLKDECPASARPYLQLEINAAALNGETEPGQPPAVDIDALFAGLRQLAETRKDVREWLEQSYLLIR